MLKPVLVAALLTLPSLPQPAFAHDEAATSELHLKNPWVAAGLGWAVTAGTLHSEQYFELPPLYGPTATIATLSPMGFGTGHFYAGDPLRGALVSVAGLIITSGLAYSSEAIHRQLYPTHYAGPFGRGTPYLNTWLLTGIAYGAWASWDAYHTAERFNLRQREVHLND